MNSASKALPGPRILIVDDDGFIVKLIARILGLENYELDFAVSGTEALSAIQENRPDLILMDYRLPGMSGIEVTRKLKSMDAFASIPVLILTGLNENEVVLECQSAGADDFVGKPFTKEALLEKVRMHVRQ